MNDNKKDLVIDVDGLLGELAAKIFTEEVMTNGLLGELAAKIFTEEVMTKSIKRYTQTIRTIFDSFEKREGFLFLLLYRNIQVCAQILVEQTGDSYDGNTSFLAASHNCLTFFAQLFAEQLSYLTVSELKFLQIKIKETTTQITKENKHEHGKI